MSLAVSHFGTEGARRPFTPRPKPVFSIEVNSEDFLVPERQNSESPPPDRFIETNPDAPENVPDATRNFSDRNQQVAQEKPADIIGSDLPSSEGKKDFESNQIVSGSLSQPEEAAPPPPPPPSELMKALREEQLQRERNPLPGDEKSVGDNETGYGFNLGKIPDNVEDIPNRIEGDKRAPLIVGAPQATVEQSRIDPQRPLPRPRLERKVRPAVLAERVEGTSNIGITGADARWSQYGEYLKRLVDSVQIEWERILGTMKAYPPPGSSVKVRFRLESTEGFVSEIIEVEGNAGNQGNRACVSAITSRAPYGKWTEDMLAVLGESQELTFTFYYQ
ncbi:MAG: hypothetical protein SFV32_07945 [Opitutaceae bacterium]|nr:hypothetical protein [Opitutaceae bacterium]